MLLIIYDEVTLFSEKNSFAPSHFNQMQNTWKTKLFWFCFFLFFFLFVVVQLGEQLRWSVPSSGVDVVELEDEGTCVRFSPLLTAAGNMNTWRNDSFTTHTFVFFSCIRALSVPD